MDIISSAPIISPYLHMSLEQIETLAYEQVSTLAEFEAANSLAQAEKYEKSFPDYMGKYAEAMLNCGIRKDTLRLQVLSSVPRKMVNGQALSREFLPAETSTRIENLLKGGKGALASAALTLMEIEENPALLFQSLSNSNQWEDPQKTIRALERIVSNNISSEKQWEVLFWSGFEAFSEKKPPAQAVDSASKFCSELGLEWSARHQKHFTTERAFYPAVHSFDQMLRRGGMPENSVKAFTLREGLLAYDFNIPHWKVRYHYTTSLQFHKNWLTGWNRFLYSIKTELNLSEFTQAHRPVLDAYDKALKEVGIAQKKTEGFFLLAGYRTALEQAA